VLGHITDCERVFGDRALRLARKDPTPLSGFDGHQFMQFADFNAWPMSELLEEFAYERRAHVIAGGPFGLGALAAPPGLANV
jgi:hypothetical protein